MQVHPQLSFFVPLIVGHAGNTGAQSVSTIIRALALEEVRLVHLWRVLAKEAASGASVARWALKRSGRGSVNRCITVSA